jgi:hypothetical protein
LKILYIILKQKSTVKANNLRIFLKFLVNFNIIAQNMLMRNDVDSKNSVKSINKTKVYAILTGCVAGLVNGVFGGGGGTTNNTVSSKYNVIVNTQATDAEGTGRAVGKAMMGYNARMANGGSY